MAGRFGLLENNEVFLVSAGGPHTLDKATMPFLYYLNHSTTFPTICKYREQSLQILNIISAVVSISAVLGYTVLQIAPAQ